MIPGEEKTNNTLGLGTDMERPGPCFGEYNQKRAQAEHSHREMYHKMNWVREES